MITVKATFKKYCPYCKTSKSPSGFDKSDISKDGFKTKCIECYKKPKEQSNNSYGFVDRIGTLELGMSIDNFPNYTIFQNGIDTYIELENYKLFDDIKDADFIEKRLRKNNYRLYSACLSFYEDKLFQVITEYCPFINDYLSEKYGRKIEDNGNDTLYLYYGDNCKVEVDLNESSYFVFQDTDVDKVVVELNRKC